MAAKFNDAVVLDLKVLKQCYFLVIVGLATRFYAATVIRYKLVTAVIKGFFTSWMTNFGSPKNLLTDMGCEFNNVEMRELGEAFNMKVMTIAAESP